MTPGKPFLLGLTGSIGMGKSTTAQMFAERGVPVWDADAAVHRLYARGGAAAPVLQAEFPQAVRDGAVDRGALRKLIADDPTALSRLEKLVHPLVAKDRQDFIAAQNAPMVVLDIPLLFETGAQDWLDAVAVVTTDAATQRARVLARPEMTEEQLQMILARQMPDAEKRARADFIIPTDDMESTRAEVDRIIAEITGRQTHA